MEYVGDLMAVMPPILLAGALYALFRAWWVKKRHGQRYGWGNEVCRLLLVCWLAGLLCLVWTPGNFWHHLWNSVLHGVPLELGDWLFSGGFSLSVSFPEMVMNAFTGGSWQVLGNVLLYLPLGLLLPLIWRECTWWRTAAVGLAVSLVTELVQPVFGRSFDLDDLIANLLGTLAGWLLFALFRLVLPRAVEKCQNNGWGRTAEKTRRPA